MKGAAISIRTSSPLETSVLFALTVINLPDVTFLVEEGSRSKPLAKLDLISTDMEYSPIGHPCVLIIYPSIVSIVWFKKTFPEESADI